MCIYDKEVIEKTIEASLNDVRNLFNEAKTPIETPRIEMNDK